MPGLYGSDDSRAAYDRLVAEFLNAGRTVPAPQVTDGPTVSTVAAAFWRHAKAFYVGADGTPTGEADNYRPAIAALRRLYGATPAKKIGLKSLGALRRAVTQPIETTDRATGETVTRAGWSRSYVNRQASRVAFIFRRAASEELVPASVPEALAQVDALRKGQDGVRETDKVQRVDEAAIGATLPHLPPPVAATVKLQLFTGARGRELFRLRSCDIVRTGVVWHTASASHKTAHHRHERTIVLGPGGPGPKMTREKSTPLAARGLSSMARSIESHTPTCCHSGSRLSRVMPQQPISRGKSSQAMPLLSTNRIPVRQTRSSTCGCPPLGLGSCLGSRGSTDPRNSSGTSGLAMASSVTKAAGPGAKAVPVLG